MVAVGALQWAKELYQFCVKRRKETQMAAVIKEDGSLVETSFKVSLDGMKRFNAEIKKPKEPNGKLIELMRFKRESKQE